MTTIVHPELEGLERYKFGWSDSDAAGESARRGLSEEVVRDISALKDEPELDLRLKGLKLFRRMPLPNWGAELTAIDFANIKYFVRSTEKQAASWDELPADIKNTYDKRFLLIAGEHGHAWCEAARQIAAETGIPLDALRVGHLDGDLYDPRCAWLRHRQIASDGAILVRPDRFIAWRHLTADNDPRAALAGALGQILAQPAAWRP